MRCGGLAIAAESAVAPPVAALRPGASAALTPVLACGGSRPAAVKMAAGKDRRLAAPGEPAEGFNASSTPRSIHSQGWLLDCSCMSARLCNSAFCAGRMKHRTLGADPRQLEDVEGVAWLAAHGGGVHAGCAICSRSGTPLRCWRCICHWCWRLRHSASDRSFAGLNPAGCSTSLARLCVAVCRRLCCRPERLQHRLCHSGRLRCCCPPVAGRAGGICPWADAGRSTLHLTVCCVSSIRQRYLTALAGDNLWLHPQGGLYAGLCGCNCGSGCFQKLCRRTAHSLAGYEATVVIQLRPSCLRNAALRPAVHAAAACHCPASCVWCHAAAACAAAAAFPSRFALSSAGLHCCIVFT